MRTRTISREFFSSVAAVLLLGLGVVCLCQTALSAAYFSTERRSALTGILDGAAAMSEVLAEDGSTITEPIVDEALRDRAEQGLELFNTAAKTLLFVTDDEGNILIHTGGDVLTGAPVPADMLNKILTDGEVFLTGDLGGVFSHKFYVLGRAISTNGSAGYIFAATDIGALGSYVGDMINMFLLSAALALLVASVLSIVFARRFTGPIEAISDAATLPPAPP